MKKRGLSNLVVMVLLTLLVLSAIIIIWAAISQVTKKSSITTQQEYLLLRNDYQILSSSIKNTGEETSLFVERNSGEENVGFRVAFEDEDGASAFVDFSNENINSLETKPVSFEIPDSLKNIRKISVYSLIQTSEGTKTAATPSSQIAQSLEDADKQRIHISSCQDLNRPNTVYILTQDLSSATDCFLIKEDNITLKGSHSISGTMPGYAVNATGKNNIIIKNLNISNFLWAIYLTNTNNSIITNNTLTSNSRGIACASCQKSTISNNLLQTNSMGIGISGGSNNNIINNVATSNTYGFSITSSSNNTIINNDAFSNTESGFYLTSISDNNMTNNTACYNNIQPTTVDFRCVTSTNNVGFSNMFDIVKTGANPFTAVPGAAGCPWVLNSKQDCP